MKFNKYYLWALTAALNFSSCVDLDYNEAVVYDEDWVYDNPTDGVKRMVSDVYAQMFNEFDTNYGGAIKASATDEADFSNSLSDIQKFYNGGWSAAYPFPDTWQRSYRAIAEIHTYLEKIDKVNLEDYRYDSNYQNMVLQFGLYPYELRFLRAYYYFELAKTYGDVPLVLKTLSNEEANNVTRTPVQDVFKFIVDECDAIAEYLPITYQNEPGNEIGRATRPAAMALKARTLLYAASPLFNTENNQELWHEAAKACKELIDRASEWGINLSTYNTLWGQNANLNTELILGINRGESNTFEMANYPVGVENGSSGNCPTQSLVDAYEYSDGSGQTFGQRHPGSINVTEEKPYDGLDPRFGFTIVKNGDTWPSNAQQALTIESYQGGFNGAPKYNATTTGYYLRKYVDGTCVTTYNNATVRRHTWIVFRLAEIYLNYAEAMYNYYQDADATGDLGMSANQAINVLRTRPDINMPEFQGNTDFLERYRRERLVELAFEDHRFWDVRRWKIGASVFASVQGADLTLENGDIILSRKVIERSWDDKYNLFPIPQTEIQKNPKLTQNPGW